MVKATWNARLKMEKKQNASTMTFLIYLEKMIKDMVSKLTLRTVSHCEGCFYDFIQLKIGTAYLARTAQAQALARRTLVAKDLV